MMNALRLTDGFPVALLRERVGEPLAAALKALEKLAASGLVRLNNGFVTPTALGQRYLNRALVEFLPLAAS
jgi:oxygen-independent coproporphyrinogen-3 oxidase